MFERKISAHLIYHDLHDGVHGGEGVQCCGCVHGKTTREMNVHRYENGRVQKGHVLMTHVFLTV